MDDSVKNLVDENVINEELNHVESVGYTPPGTLTEQSPGGASGAVVDRTEGPTLSKRLEKKSEVKTGGSLADALIDDTLEGLSESAKTVDAISRAREQQATDSQITALRNEIKTLLEQPQKPATENDGESDVVLLEKRLKELEGQQQAVEATVRKTKPKDKLNAFTDDLFGSMMQDLKVLASIPQALKGARLKTKTERQAVNTQNEINKFRISKGLDPIEVGIRVKKVGKKQNVKVRESVDDLKARLDQQVQDAKGLGMSTPKNYESAQEAFNSLKTHSIKHPPRF